MRRELTPDIDSVYQKIFDNNLAEFSANEEDHQEKPELTPEQLADVEKHNQYVHDVILQEVHRIQHPAEPNREFDEPQTC